jgi:MGT family glycosyltransferase
VRAIVSAMGDAGHALPAIGFAQELHSRGHKVRVQTTSKQWGDPVEGIGMQHVVRDDHVPFRERANAAGPTLAEVALALAPEIEEFGAEVVVNDVHGLAHALAAEAAGIPRATLMATLYAVFQPGLPPFPSGLMPPRTRLGAAAWGALRPTVRHLLERGRRELNVERAEMGLPPVQRFDSAISEGLAMVATFPQLEYPRRWPSHVHVTGPVFFEPPAPKATLPQGEWPLVVVSTSTVFDPGLRLATAALEALEGERVRVLVTISRMGEQWTVPVPENAAVVDWISFAQVIPETSLVVSTGGHGTVVRALSDGVPVLVCPGGADQGENGARVAWAGAGLLLPRRLLGPRSLRWSVRRVLADGRFVTRAREIAAWSRENRGPPRAADLLERYAQGASG